MYRWTFHFRQHPFFVTSLFSGLYHVTLSLQPIWNCKIISQWPMYLLTYFNNRMHLQQFCNLLSWEEQPKYPYFLYTKFKEQFKPQKVEKSDMKIYRKKGILLFTKWRLGSCDLFDLVRSMQFFIGFHIPKGAYAQRCKITKIF